MGRVRGKDKTRKRLRCKKKRIKDARKRESVCDAVVKSTYQK